MVCVCVGLKPCWEFIAFTKFKSSGDGENWFFLTYKLDARDFGSTLKSEERFPLISLEQALNAHARRKLTILEIQLSVQPQVRGGMRSKLSFGAHFTPQHAQRQAAEATRCTSHSSFSHTHLS